MVSSTVRRLAASAVLVAVTLVAPLPGASATADPSIDCLSASVPATPSASMAGTLCVPLGGEHTVIVLVPGSSYNHAYWDFPYEPSTYSFRLAMNQAGYSTFVVDRLGTGASTRPPSALVTATTQANAVHEVVQSLRRGVIGGIAFEHVVLGGHSLGSAITVIESASFNDVDAVLLTGQSHFPNPTGAALLYGAAMYPAGLDPKFAGQGYDLGYLTTRPGTRSAAFYNISNADPNVIEVDEQTKDVFSALEVPDAAVLDLTPGVGTLLLRVPTLLVTGSSDVLVCNPIVGNCANDTRFRSLERPYFPSTPCFETWLLPAAGHDVNLARNAPAYDDTVRRWMDAHVGRDAVAPPPTCLG